MAVTTAANVIAASANGDTITGRSLSICGIKIVETGGAALHIRVRQSSSGGIVIYEAKVASGAESWADAELKGVVDLYIEYVTGAGNIYFYSE